MEISMARKLRSKIATRTARLALPRSDWPIWETVSRTAAGTVRLGYRPTKIGCWLGASSDGKEGYVTKALRGIVPDDHEDADGTNVLNFEQAAEMVRKLYRSEAGAVADAPATVASALADFSQTIVPISVLVVVTKATRTVCRSTYHPACSPGQSRS
jgi:hypothetical protein